MKRRHNATEDEPLGPQMLAAIGIGTELFSLVVLEEYRPLLATAGLVVTVVAVIGYAWRWWRAAD